MATLNMTVSQVRDDVILAKSFKGYDTVNITGMLTWCRNRVKVLKHLIDRAEPGATITLTEERSLTTRSDSIPPCKLLELAHWVKLLQDTILRQTAGWVVTTPSTNIVFTFVKN